MSVSDTFGLQLAKYTNVAGLTILIYDYFVTLHSEVQWTWGRKWGITRTVFTFSRYGPFACALMTLYSAIKTWGTQDCAPFNDALNGLHFLSIVAAEVLLIFRVYAFSGEKKAYLISILLFGSAILVTSVVISAAPINWRIPGGEVPLARWKGLIAAPFLLMSTTAFLRYRHYLGSHSALMKSVYRDGLLYMLCITMISTINVIVIALLPVSSFVALVDLKDLSKTPSSHLKLLRTVFLLLEYYSISKKAWRNRSYPPTNQRLQSNSMRDLEAIRQLARQTKLKPADNFLALSVSFIF
ncbi:hypothetical protein BDR06DRAFT_1006160 [Suillus hirtellus]|nr:hypothetical protein BDR06DRAFT_1006160 [Suillus hirtellus]